jgi:hypothetical protein
LRSAAEVSFLKKIELENYYDNNILRLSETDLDLFEAGSEAEKFEAQSSDDLVTAALLDLGIKHYFAGGHTQINRVVLKYNKYWNNSFKDNGYIRFSLQQYLSREFNFQLNYYYYPEIYSNYYRSEIDDEYHSYTYAKNVYNARLDWDAFKFLSFTYWLEFSQNYFNKYFTEYDSDNIENRLDLRFKLLPNLISTFSYAFKVSQADADKAYDDISGSIQFKDASYEANLFFVQFEIPRIFPLNREYVKFALRTAFEGYYFQSNITGDDYHLQRDDNYFRVHAALNLPVQKNMDLELFLKRDERRTDSPYNFVEEDKNFCQLRAGFSLKIEL